MSVLDIPETQYARTKDGVEVAYQVWGDGPFDLVLLNFDVAIDAMWEDPLFRSLLERLGAFARTISLDRRGWGSSQALTVDVPTSLDAWLDDIAAVTAAVGSERAAFIGGSETGGPLMMYAATYPERVSALVLFNAYARFLRAPDYPCGLPAERADRYIQSVLAGWGTSELVELVAPSMVSNTRWTRWYMRMARLGGSPADTAEYLRASFDTNVHRVLASIQAPALVLHRRGNRHVRREHGQYLAEQIPGAVYRELDGDDLCMAAGDVEGLADEIEEFLTGVRPAKVTDRILATVMFTDIVGSTQMAGELGDRAWRTLLDAHDALVRAELERYRGREIETSGDGFMATFDGPARAIRCATQLIRALRGLGIDIRVGVHTGEVEVRGDGISGIAVHTGARVAALAGVGEVLVSSTVKDLVAGSGTSFDDRGEHRLKGVPGLYHLFSVGA